MAFWADGVVARNAPIDVTYNRETLLTFIWRGDEHPIDKVRNKWRIRSYWWLGREVWRDYYERGMHADTTEDGIWCEIYRDRIAGEWKLERVYE